MKKKLLNILFWSVISAAFIGPGTITTASLAGASHGVSLLWALLFSTLACMVLQEGAARITIASGLTIGEAVELTFGNQPWMKWLLGGAVIFGCAAYEAGNIVGAISGAGLLFSLPPWVFTLAITGIAAVLLWGGSAGSIARSVGMLVAVMGVAFLYTSFFINESLLAITKGLFIPQIPADDILLVIGLVGTTIVPYNLFLGSGLGKGQQLGEMRLGLIIAIGLGGIVSMAVLLSGTLSSLPFSFEEMASVLEKAVGLPGKYLFALGLFAAGFTSTITAPLASTITAQSIWGKGEKNWEGTGTYYRLVWGAILIVGLVFGLLGLRPVPVILLAQAINGVLLPVAATGLLLVLNNTRLMVSHINGPFSNFAGLLIVGVTLFLGIHQVARAIFMAIGYQGSFDSPYFVTISLLALLPLIWLGIRIFKR
ncbi:divalent metal cation transporter [Imperialibacter roseus]|uniref:Divalent metal cation transporter n=1 Tax=Imperialibacter roseus TaxID=1324217 RepID=A0ABZ0IRJ9_9BACT|nr:divalent metal cation transporter [Imperialibacter roseus]WOK06217.1 divalent metal cation transporter [Imperialibacter roseus]